MSVVYEVNGRFRDVPLGENVSASVTDLESQAALSPAWSKATLEIQYPHPDGLTGLARATLRLSDAREKVEGGGWMDPQTAFRSEPIHDFAFKVLRDDEVWVMDVPEYQIDLMLAELHQKGFFDNDRPEGLGTRLAVELNRNRTAKDWSAEPRLDEFVHRVHAQGRLSGFVSRGS